MKTTIELAVSFRNIIVERAAYACGVIRLLKKSNRETFGREQDRLRNARFVEECHPIFPRPFAIAAGIHTRPPRRFDFPGFSDVAGIMNIVQTCENPLSVP